MLVISLSNASLSEEEKNGSITYTSNLTKSVISLTI